MLRVRHANIGHLLYNTCTVQSAKTVLRDGLQIFKFHMYDVQDPVARSCCTFRIAFRIVSPLSGLPRESAHSPLNPHGRFVVSYSPDPFIKWCHVNIPDIVRPAALHSSSYCAVLYLLYRTPVVLDEATGTFRMLSRSMRALDLTTLDARACSFIVYRYRNIQKNDESHVSCIVKAQ